MSIYFFFHIVIPGSAFRTTFTLNDLNYVGFFLLSPFKHIKGMLGLTYELSPFSCSYSVFISICL